MIAHKSTIVVSVLVAASLGGRSVAQEVLPVPPTPFKGQIGLSAKDSKPDFPQPMHAPQDAPNVVLVLLDDVRFGASSTFGGPIDTPTLERLAKSGLRYTQFHTTALCSPTRAALLTGRNHHSVHTAMVMETATGFPGYDSTTDVTKNRRHRHHPLDAMLTHVPHCGVGCAVPARSLGSGIASLT